MASSSIVTKIREHFAVGMSLVGLLVNMGPRLARPLRHTHPHP